jgi:uncharacterized membrane protein SpoIIM required for sporulation
MEIFNHPRLPLYILFLFCIFTISMLCILPFLSPSESEFNLLKSDVSLMTTSNIFLTIFLNNLRVMFLIMSLGILGVRLVPIVFVAANSYMAANVIATVHNPAIAFAVMFPHGYFEFSLLFFCGACSLIIIDEIKKTGLNAITLLKKHGDPRVRFILKNYLFYPYIFIVIPGVFITAAIESTFSFWNLRILVGV